MLCLLSIVSWQRTEPGYISLRYKTCSVSCHRFKTTVRAWWYIPQVWNMLCQLSLSHNKGQSMVMYPSSMKHAPSSVIVSWQWSKHGYISVKYETCFVSCQRLMTTIYPSCFKHAQSVVIVSWQRTEHGYLSLRYETCFVCCHRLTTTVRSWWYIPQVGNMLRQLSSSRDNR